MKFITFILVCSLSAFANAGEFNGNWTGTAIETSSNGLVSSCTAANINIYHSENYIGADFAPVTCGLNTSNGGMKEFMISDNNLMVGKIIVGTISSTLIDVNYCTGEMCVEALAKLLNDGSLVYIERISTEDGWSQIQANLSQQN